MSKQPRRWIEFVLEPYPAGTATTYRWATRPLAGTFFVDGRITSDGWDNITRRASSASGEYSIDSASIIINDADGLVRSLLADTTTQWFKNREAAFNLLSEAAFTAGLTPRILFGGRCFDVQVQDGRKARMEFEDILSPYMDRIYPQYTIGDAYPFRFTEADEVDATLDTDDPGFQIPVALRDQVLPIYYGPFIDSAVDPITGLQRSKGLCPAFFMGYTYLTAGTGTIPDEPSPELAAVLQGEPTQGWGGWGELLIAMGDEYSIPNVYVTNGVGFSTEPAYTSQLERIRLTSDRYGIDVLAPGHAGWPFATDYVMRNGFRCWVIYARGPVLWHHITGLVNITVDLCSPIDQAGFVYQDFISEHVLAHDGDGYTAGPKAGLPLFADGRSMIWTSKVQAWQALTAERLGTTKGYLCSMALTEPKTLREILRTWHVTFDAFSAKNAAGQLYPFSIDDLSDPTDGVAIRERIELTGLPAPRIAWDEIENEITYTVGYDPEQKTARTPELTITNQPAIDAMKGEVRNLGPRALSYTADDATATDAMSRRLLRLSEPPRYQPLPVLTDGVDREIGEQVRVSHQDGIGAAGIGYDDQPMVLMAHVHKGNNIELEALDISRILATAIGAPVDTGGYGWGWSLWP